MPDTNSSPAIGNFRAIHKRIAPSLGYNVVSWQHVEERKLYILTRLERHAVLIVMMTRGLSSTPTSNLEIVAGVLPINFCSSQQAVKSALRMKNGNWDSNATE